MIVFQSGFDVFSDLSRNLPDQLRTRPLTYLPIASPYAFSARDHVIAFFVSFYREQITKFLLGRGLEHRDTPHQISNFIFSLRSWTIFHRWHGVLSSFAILVVPLRTN